MSFVRTHLRVVFQLSFFILFLLLLQIFASYSFVYQASIKTIEQKLIKLTDRIEKDLVYMNGKWDTTLYNSDPYTPYPNGSSGFTNPLYVITNEGFIIERSEPIRGFLDTSDFKHLAVFTSPQTINAITNESWRVLSKMIISKGKTLGVVVISFYNPKQSEIGEIDNRLKENVELIYSKINVTNGTIDISRIDIRNIHYEYSFEIVDKYNNVLLNNGRVPTFIDPSYFSNEAKNKRIKVISDSETKEPYYTVSKILKYESHPIGMIIAGESIHSLNQTLKKYIYFAVGISIVIIIPLILYTFFVLRREFIAIDNNTQKTIKAILFDKKRSALFVDDKEFGIPYGSHQYYICIALFSQPQKNWEYDELLEKMGDIGEQVNTRKVYDAVLAINKRINLKLIEYKNKTFCINEHLRKSIMRS